MSSITTKAMICLDDDLGFSYKVSKIEYVLREDESFTYTFTPNYSVIDLLTTDLFQGIPGLNIDLRKPQYVRNNLTPVFISERTPGENREDIRQLLENCGMEYLNRLEWLIRTNTRYSGDRLYAERFTADHDKHCVAYAEIEQSESRSASTIAHILRMICAGNDIKATGFLIDDINRKNYYSLLMSLYQKEKSYVDKHRAAGIRKSAAKGNYRGRTPIRLDDTRLIEVITEYKSGKLNAQDAATALGLSRSTFFRKLKKTVGK
jgi:hypothetical protein